MKSSLKSVLGSIPYTADLYDAIRRERPRTRYNLEQLKAALPTAVEQARPYAEKAPHGKKLLLFATLHYWVEQAAMVGLALRGLGHDVTVAYLPYGDWRKEINGFDLRRQALYTQRVLKPLSGLVNTASLLEVFNELMQVKGNTEDLSTPEKVFAKMSTTIPVFEGASFAAIPDTGIQMNIGEE